MNGSDLLNSDEQSAIQLISQLTLTIRKIVGYGPNASKDLQEAESNLHALQYMIMSQAAARAYPKTYRQLGKESLPE